MSYTGRNDKQDIMDLNSTLVKTEQKGLLNLSEMNGNMVNTEVNNKSASIDRDSPKPAFFLGSSKDNDDSSTGSASDEESKDGESVLVHTTHTQTDDFDLMSNRQNIELKRALSNYEPKTSDQPLRSLEECLTIMNSDVSAYVK